MKSCRYCGRYTRLRPCCPSLECLAKAEDYDSRRERELAEQRARRKGNTWGPSEVATVSLERRART